MAAKRTFKRGLQMRTRAEVPISPDRADKMRREIEQKEEYLDSLKTGKQLSDGTSGMKVENIDIKAIEKQIDREKEALKYMAPEEGNASQKRKAKVEFEQARKYISENALTLAEVGKYPKPSDPSADADYGKAVEKSIAMEVGNPKFAQMFNQLKRAASILDPENPELRNVNKYRRER